MSGPGVPAGPGAVPPSVHAPVPAPLPKAPGATAALVLGIVSLAGSIVLLAPVFLAPLACYHAVAARRRIDREPGRWSGRSEAQTGLVLGVVASVVMVMAVVLLLLATGGVLLSSRFDSGYGT